MSIWNSKLYDIGYSHSIYHGQFSYFVVFKKQGYLI